jgi:putative transposase
LEKIEEHIPLDTWVVLSDHLHCVWTLPPDDDDFTNRWRLIKQRFSKGFSNGERRSSVRIARGERGICTDFRRLN